MYGGSSAFGEDRWSGAVSEPTQLEMRVHFDQWNLL
jgi:hypothetical protein